MISVADKISVFCNFRRKKTSDLISTANIVNVYVTYKSLNFRHKNTE